VGSVLRGWVIYDVVVAVSYLGSGRLFGFAAKQLKVSLGSHGRRCFFLVEFLAMGTGKNSEECTQDIFGCWEVSCEMMMMTILFFLDSCL
jgi:hypothetical protein